MSTPSTGRIRDLSLAWQYRRATPHIVVVLGMHRSGTSCASRILNLMGAELGTVIGDDEVAEGEEAHWESAYVNWLNEDMLKRAGGSWHDPPADVRPSRRDRLRCKRALWELAGAKVASIKDPRMLITFPVWREVLPEHSYVACLRHPLNVARSLERRDGLAIDAGIELWYTYNARLAELTSERRPIAWFDFDEGAPAARSLVQRVAAQVPLQPTAAALGHYNPKDQHHVESMTLTGKVGELYGELRRRAAGAGQTARTA